MLNLNSETPSIDALVLDQILYKGHNLYGKLAQEIGEIRYLEIKELPTKLPMYNSKPLYELSYEDRIVDNITEVCWRPIQNNDINIFSVSRYLEYCFESSASKTIMININQNVSSAFIDKQMYYYFDSHSRNENGLPEAEGSAILLNFCTLQDFGNYIIHITEKLTNDIHTFSIYFAPVAIVNIPNRNVRNLEPLPPIINCDDVDIQREMDHEHAVEYNIKSMPEIMHCDNGGVQNVCQNTFGNECICYYKPIDDKLYGKSQCLAYMLKMSSNSVVEVNSNVLHSIASVGFSSNCYDLSNEKNMYIHFFGSCFHVKSKKM